MVISSEFCDVDGEHQGPAVHTLIDDRQTFYCAKCWQQKFPDVQFPLEKVIE